MNKRMHKIILVTHNFKIEDRRKRVATLLAQSMTETEIAQEQKVESRSINCYQRYQSTKGIISAIRI